MTFPKIYRISMYAMLVVATLILSIDAGEYNRFATMYPLIVFAAAAAAYLTVDQNPKLGLTRDLANFIAMGSFILAVIEYWSNPDAMLLAVGHWLVYLQLVKMFLPKSSEDYWYLMLLALVQVMVGTFMSHSDWMAALLFGYALLSLWNLALFYLQREHEANRQPPGVRVRPETDRARPYSGLFTPGFFATTASVALSTLALGAFIFLLMPRWSESGTGGGYGQARHLTGFSDEVRLGQMGEILENNALVMNVELRNGDEEVIGSGEDFLYRGLTLTNYENGKWSRSLLAESDVRSLSSVETLPPDVIIHQKISLLPMDSNVLFSIRVALGAGSRRQNEVLMNLLDGNLARRDPRSDELEAGTRSGRKGSFTYEVISVREQFTNVPSPEARVREGYLEELLQVPSDVRSQLEPVNQAVLDGYADAPAADRARLLEEHLRDSGEYSYTLQMSSVPAGVDPVVNFVATQKRGHCEYFASALALQLRTAGIPARLVNGFKGGDWNPLVRAYSVREKHAHSWVEALIVDPVSRRQRWITLDPTPDAAREAIVSRVGGPTTRFRTVLDAMRYIWAFYVVGFDPERQTRLIYRPITEAANAVIAFGKQVVGILIALISGLFVFRTPGDFFSTRGFVASVAVMLMLSALFWVGRAIMRLLLRRRASRRQTRDRANEIAFFRRMIEFLRSLGLEKTPAETPREFAARAEAMMFAQYHASDPSLLLIPKQVIDAFYRVRFGNHELDTGEVEGLNAGLDRLESAIQNDRARRTQANRAEPRPDSSGLGA